MKNLIPLTLQDGGSEKSNKEKAEELYGGLKDKFWEALDLIDKKNHYLGEHIWQTMQDYTPNALNYLIEAPTENYYNKVPELTPIMLDAKNKLSTMTPQQIADIATKDYSKANLFNIGKYLPEGVGIIDALRYKNEYEKIKKAGFMFQDGGKTQEQLYNEIMAKPDPRFTPSYVFDSVRGEYVPSMKPLSNKSDTLFVSNPNDSRLKAYEDSLKLHNTSQEVVNFYKNNPFYTPTGETLISSRDTNPHKANEEALNDFRNYGVTNGYKESDYYRNIDDTFYEQRELQNQQLNLQAPFQLYNRNINPDRYFHFKGFGSSAGDLAGIYTYSEAAAPKPTQPVAYRNDWVYNENSQSWASPSEAGRTLPPNKPNSVRPKETTIPIPTKSVPRELIKLDINESDFSSGVKLPKTDLNWQYKEENGKYYVRQPKTKSNVASEWRPITKKTYEEGLKNTDEDLGFRPTYQRGGIIPKQPPQLLPNDPPPINVFQNIERQLHQDYGSGNKAMQFIEEKIPTKYLMSDEWIDDEVDAMRHASAAMYLANTGKGVGAAYRAIPAFVQTNVSGLGHEIANWEKNSSWMDIANNFKGSMIGANPLLTLEEKEQELLKMLEQGKLNVISPIQPQPEIFKSKQWIEKHGKQDGGRIMMTKKEYETSGGTDYQGYLKEMQKLQFQKNKENQKVASKLDKPEVGKCKDSGKSKKQAAGCKRDASGNPVQIERNQQGGIIKDNMGQWAHPGQITQINSPNISMQGVNYPVLGIDAKGNKQLMQPNKNYLFLNPPVTEYPMKKQSGGIIDTNSQYQINPTLLPDIPNQGRMQQMYPNPNLPPYNLNTRGTISAPNEMNPSMGFLYGAPAYGGEQGLTAHDFNRSFEWAELGNVAHALKSPLVAGNIANYVGSSFGHKDGGLIPLSL